MTICRAVAILLTTFGSWLLPPIAYAADSTKLNVPFIISDVNKALVVAGAVVGVELFAIAWIRNRFLEVSMRSSLLVVTVGGAIVLAIGVAIGSS